jgi:hypothetical protein
MSSTAEVPTEDAAGEWGTNPASKVEKKPAPEKDNNSTREDGGIGVNLMLGKEQVWFSPYADLLLMSACSFASVIIFVDDLNWLRVVSHARLLCNR